MGREKGSRLDDVAVMFSMIFDVCSIAVALFLAGLTRFGPGLFTNSSSMIGTWGIYSLFALLLSDMEGVFHARTYVNYALLVYRMIRIALIVSILYVITVFLFKLPSAWFQHSRLVVVMTFLYWCFFSIHFRLLLPHFVIFLSKIRLIRLAEVKVLACGNPEVIPKVRVMLEKSSLYRRFLKFRDCDDECPAELAERLAYYRKRMFESDCDDLCIAEDGASFDSVAPFIIDCFREGISLSFYSSIFENLGYYDSWISFPERPAIVFFNPPMSRAGEVLWRVIDVVLSAMALLALLPLFGILAVLIKLSSSGPVFFRQKRVGLGGKPFVFLKFRSMKNTTGSNVRAHRDYFAQYAKGIAAGNEGGNGYKLRDDNCITMIGKFIRRTSMDELPQLLNVLRGDMSLVGPRPCIAYEMDYYKDWYRYRFSVKPGLTGIWQVYGRSRLPLDAAQFLDLSYALTRSIRLNTRLLLKTIPVVLSGRGGV